MTRNAGRRCCNIFGFVCFGVFLSAVTVWFVQGWFLRWKVAGFDYEKMGIYSCVDLPEKMNWTWHDIQHVQMGARGAAFATFSDRWLRARHVDFDYRLSLIHI